MLRIKINYIIILYLSGLFLFAENINWKKLDNGLNWKIFNYKKNASTGFNIHVLKIDPNLFSLHLLSAKEKNHSPISLYGWCKKYNLIAGINASMYLPDRLKSTGYMKNFNNINNAKINMRFGAFIVFNPKERQKQKALIIDKTTHSWKSRIYKYNTIIQNYRIIDIQQKIVWKKNNNISSIAAFGIDRSANVLFILCPDKISTFDFAEIILKLPINIYNLSYLEGGHEASLYLNHKNLHTKINGKLFNSNKINLFLGNSSLPNIIGIRKK